MPTPLENKAIFIQTEPIVLEFNDLPNEKPLKPSDLHWTLGKLDSMAESLMPPREFGNSVPNMPVYKATKKQLEKMKILAQKRKTAEERKRREDWAYTPLFAFILEEHCRNLLKEGLVEDHEVEAFLGKEMLMKLIKDSATNDPQATQSRYEKNLK